jgi:hypothetical protein
MSTRCNIHFTDRGHVLANVYRHTDGYPDGESGVMADLARFLDDVEAQTTDTRFADPSYLAAKFVVWQAAQWASDGKPLEFLGLGVCTGDAGDGAYVYTVECGQSSGYPSPRPKVTVRKARVTA